MLFFSVLFFFFEFKVEIICLILIIYLIKVCFRNDFTNFHSTLFSFFFGSGVLLFVLSIFVSIDLLFYIKKIKFLFVYHLSAMQTQISLWTLVAWAKLTLTKISSSGVSLGILIDIYCVACHFMMIFLSQS